ncbi:MAG TPA: NAD(P)/FAD-dependent oxidoreductase [Acidimicrobiales bacterium]|nr:NAD(P)/FAD-dependent oxidoreductase [Acidimicrobiales bacterium]
MGTGQGDHHRSTPRVVVIGAGMAGILSAIKLHEAGYRDLAVYEKADRYGGTWRENTYPGVACDVPSHLYSYSFAPNPEWSRIFASGPEILAYLEEVAVSSGIDHYVHFGAEVERLDRVHDRWHLTMADGRVDEADIVIAATGVLHHPAYPDIPGIDAFAGPSFHTARWDHSVPLEGRRVGIIGTGSSAIQVVSALADRVEELKLFQRTPQWILPVPNPVVDEEERARLRADRGAIADARQEMAKMFEDNFANAVVDADSPQVRLLQEMCQANLEHSVTDPELRERLRPSYRAACKRLIISPDFYEAIQHPHARLVTDSVVGIEADGVRTSDGVLHELDVLVLATGFRVDRFLRPIEVTGRHGVRLDDVWAERPSAYLSIAIPQFPNLFMLNGPNGPVGNFSLIDVAEMQLAYVMQLIDLVAGGTCRAVEADAGALARYEVERLEAAKKTVWVTGCRSWYLDDRGVPAAWPWSFDRFRQAMAGPDLADFVLERS